MNRRFPNCYVAARGWEELYPLTAVIRRRRYQKRERAESTFETALPSVTHIRFEDLSPPVTLASVQLSHLLLRDGLPHAQKGFSEYEVAPVKMLAPNQFDVL